MKSEIIWGIWGLTFDHCKLGEFIHITSGKECPPEKKTDYSTIPIRGATGIIGYSTEPLYERPIILVGRVGAGLLSGMSGILNRADKPCWPSDNTLVIIPKDDDEFDYIECCLRYSDIYPYVSGSSQPLLTQTALKLLEIPWSSRETRHMIANNGRQIDRLLLLNNNIENISQEIITALFRSWFIDFDPVKAKTEGKLLYGMNEETAALFPDSFEDSELGSIPKGWEIVTISDVCDFVSRGVTPDYEDGTGSWIINQKVNNGVNLNLENLKELSKSCIVPEDKFAKRFDVLVNCLGEGTLGRIHFFTGDSDYYAVDQHMSICRAKSPSAGLYIYHTLSSPTGQWRIDSVKTGSTGMTMFNISKLRAFKIYIPPQRILDEFWANVSNLIHQNQICLETGNVLIHTRDVLLPRLMSRELKVN